MTPNFEKYTLPQRGIRYERNMTVGIACPEYQHRGRQGHSHVVEWD
jgi:hypothetical protein